MRGEAQTEVILQWTAQMQNDREQEGGKDWEKKQKRGGEQTQDAGQSHTQTHYVNQ